MIPTLREAIRQTIIYFDLFEFAPTLLEVEKWLLRYESPSVALSTLQEHLENDPAIKHREGFFFLAGRDHLVFLRQQKYHWTDEKWKATKRYIRWLAMMPGVEGVWLANAMGWGNAKQKSDIDLVIITTPGHLWSARFWTTALMKLLRKRPGETEENPICLSVYIAADHLDLLPYKIAPNDIHFAFWATQFFPLYDHGSFQALQKVNPWLKTVFQNIRWEEPTPKRIIHLSFPERLLKHSLRLLSGESFLRALQYRCMPNLLKSSANTGSGVVIAPGILKLHTNDNRQQIQNEWERRIAETTLSLV